MDYPQDFPAESRAKVEAAIIRAGRQFDFKKAKAKWRSDIEALFWTYVLTPFLVFAGESSRLGLWQADVMDGKCREFLRLLTIDAYYRKGKAAGLSDMISNWNGGIVWEAQQKIEKTPQWRKYENIRLKFAANRVESSRAQNSANTANSVENKSTKEADGANWFDSDPDTVRRRQLVLRNPRMPSKSLCNVFDAAPSPIPLPRDWQAELGVNTWSDAYKKPTGRKRIQKIVSTDRKAV